MQLLTDVLEEFNESSQVDNAANISPLKTTGPEELMEDQEAFMKLLQENMAKLMGAEVGGSEETPEVMINSTRPVAPAASMSPPPAIPSTDDFQDTISQTLNKLKSSSHQAKTQVKWIVGC
jgi:hypothetical protein